MATESASTAQQFDLKSLAIVERLADYAAQHPSSPYVISTEKEAGELLMLISLVTKARADTISSPMPMQGDDLDKMRKKYNRDEWRLVVKMSYRFKRAAANGMALQFCLDEFGHTPLELFGTEITFECASPS